MSDNKTKERSIRLEPELDAVLQCAADAEHTSVSQIIRKCIRLAIDSGELTRDTCRSAALEPSRA